jgi:hypothetical protein
LANDDLDSGPIAMNLADMNTFYADFDLILKKKERAIVKILLSV